VGQDRGRREALREGDLKRPTYGVRVWVEDVNGDGKLDLLVGDSVTLVSPAKGLSDEEMVKKAGEWEVEFKKAQAKMSALYEEMEKEEKKDEKKDGKEKKEETKEQKEAREARDKELRKASEEYSKLYQKRSEFMTEEMTGFVWLYVRK
jgi:hypothetical protein